MLGFRLQNSNHNNNNVSHNNTPYPRPPNILLKVNEKSDILLLDTEVTKCEFHTAELSDEKFQLLSAITEKNNLPIRTYYDNIILPHAYETLFNTVQFFIRPENHIHRVHLHIDTDPILLHQLPLGLFDIISKIQIISNGMIMFQGTGLQLWSFYQGLNPLVKSWDSKTSIPLPIHPNGFTTTYCSLEVMVYFHTFKLNVNELVFHIDDILQNTVPRDIVFLMGKYIDENLSPPTFHLKTYAMKFDPKEFPYIDLKKELRMYRYSPISISTKKANGTYQMKIPQNYNHKIMIICVAGWNAETQTYFTPHETHFINHFQPRIGNTFSKMEPVIFWDKNDKVQNFFNTPEEIRLYTKTFDVPCIFETPPNYLITESRVPMEAKGILSNNVKEYFQILWEWNDQTPIGSKIFVWTICENEIIYADHLVANKFY
jgi:hypothetical protein